MPGPVIRDPTPAWLTKPQPEEALVVKALRILAGLIGADDPTSQVLGIANTTVPARNALRAVAESLTKRGPIRAYHGSPHDFEKFDLRKIGTGEGAQAYGHGLYFAENEATAKAYRDQLAPGVQRIVGGGAYDSRSPEHLAASLLRTYKGSADPKATALEALKADIANPNVVEAQKDIYRKTVQLLEHGAQLPSTEVVPRGRMYEVNIHADPESLLDWNKPIPQQSSTVRDRLLADPVVKRRMDATLRPSEHTGRTIYSALEGVEPRPSERLRSAGIPGIKYLDQGSRAASEGTRNYVMFDDSIIEILRKWGLLPAAVGTGAAMDAEQ